MAFLETLEPVHNSVLTQRALELYLGFGGLLELLFQGGNLFILGSNLDSEYFFLRGKGGGQSRQTFFQFLLPLD